MKKAFTMLELVFVIIVVGIISATLIQNTQRNTTREAAQQLVSHLRYTQHLALSDDKFDISDINGSGDTIWYKRRWTLVFNSDAYADSKQSYTIFADTAGDATGLPTFNEIARNPENSDHVLSGGFTGDNRLKITDTTNFVGTKKLNLGTTYNITNITLSADCSFSNSRRIAFDHMGRPLIGNISSYTQPYMGGRIMNGQCVITLTDGNEDSTAVAIEPETGYSHII